MKGGMFMSTYEMEAMLEMFAGSIGSFIGPIVATLLSGIILTYCIRWFIFVKAGQKGWKALIPFYSDYITYKIAWDGRIYLATLIASIASTVLGSVFGLIHPALGMVFSIILSTVATAAKAIADLILNFKLARAFGKSDYFFVGLYFLNNVFTAILAFGECEYQGPPKDKIGVPKFIDKFGKKNNDFVDYRNIQPKPMQRPVQPVQPQQPMGAAQPMQQQYQQYPQAMGGAQMQQYPQQQYQQPYNTGSYPPVQQYPQQNQNFYHQ